MRVAMLNITSGGISGGYQEYLKHIIPQLATHPEVSALLVAFPETVNFPGLYEDFPLVDWLPIKPALWPVPGIGNKVKKEVKKFAPDVVFIPTARFWKMNRIPTVNMIRNMEPLIHFDQNPLPERILNWIRAKAAEKSLFNADRIIAVSAYVKELLIKRFNVNPENIGVVYHGVDNLDDIAFQKSPLVPQLWKSEFLFTAGSIRPARGLEDALYAIKFLLDLPQISGLVVAGEACPRMKAYKSQLQKWLQMQCLSGKVRWTGQLRKEEMAWCYQNCRVFLMTSRVEACPNIAIEAMSHGCVCISTNLPPMPEIFGDAAIFYPPKKPGILAERIHEVLNWSEDKRQEMRQRAVLRASQFSWDKCTERTVTELKKAIENFKRSGCGHNAEISWQGSQQ